jgi:hypothetical protein
MKLTSYARGKLADAYQAMIGDGGRIDLFDGESDAIASFSLCSPCGMVEDETLWLDFEGDAVATRDGKPSRASLVSASGREVMTLTVGAKGDRADLVIHPLELVKDGPVRCDGFAISCRAPRGE